MIRKETVYFEKPGPENSADCLGIVQRMVQAGAKHVVVASTRGETGLLFARGLPAGKANLVVVAHAAGFAGTGVVEFDAEKRRAIEERGGRVVQATMPFHSVENGIEKKFSGTLPASLVAHTLRIFGQGAKVGCEIVMMAADAGLVPEGAEVVAVGGTRWGADTVLVVRSAASRNFLDLKVLEIAAKPREW